MGIVYIRVVFCDESILSTIKCSNPNLILSLKNVQLINVNISAQIYFTKSNCGQCQGACFATEAQSKVIGEQ